MHAVSDFVGGLWRNNSEPVAKQNIQAEEYESQIQWKRDFEQGESGFLGEIRDKLRKAKHEAKLPSNGLQIRARNLNYISPPLDSEISTVPSYIMDLFNVYRNVKNLVSPDLSRKRQILSNINFSIKEGSMTLVIGSPGSGKSSLCKILANQEIAGEVTGDISFGGEPVRLRDHTHRVAYVRDKDTHLAHLTVKETMDFAYTLLTPNATSEERSRRVGVILQVLGLSHRENTIVGDDLVRGVSGGERRRVTIGVELVKQCQLLVMDEATTGLDSSTSLQIFRALRILADEVAPVFATLKQPGRDLFQLFDNVIVLHDGKMVYSGASETMLDYFEEHGYSVNRVINPADEVLSLVSKFGDELVQLYAENENSESMDLAMNDETLKESPQVAYKKYNQGWLTQFWWGTKRGLLLIKNNPGITVSRIIFAMIMAFIIGAMFFQIGDSQSSISGIQGSLFLVSTFPAFQALAGLPTVFSMRPVYYYQRKNKYYHPIPIIFADFIATLPVTLIESIAFSTVCYWMIGFNPLFIRYFYFILSVFLLELLFSIIVKIAGFILPTFQVANILIPPLVFLNTFFAGFAIILDRAPSYLQWIYWVTPFRYLLEGLSINQFYDTDFECDDDEFVPPTSDRRYNLPFEQGGFEGNQICPIQTGEQILMGNDYETEYAYAWYWFLVIVLYCLIAFLLMFITSFWTFKEKLPRDLRYTAEKRTEHNRKVNSLKDSLRNSIRASTSSSSEDEEDYTEGEDLLLPGLGPRAKGKRIETHVPIYLEWQKLSYTVKVLPPTGIFSILGNLPIINRFALQDERLLNDVSGYVKPGMLIAFMGPSGAGKTTLLDVLSKRKTAGKIDGQIRVNGAPIDTSTLARFAGYVEQNNIHVESETVEEALKLSATLRLCYPGAGKSISRKERLEHILWVMNVLSLTEIRDAMISELSLEQKKRVTIGVELAANPSLLFLDEPTSGLDAVAALNVMKAMKTISDSGVAVVCTLHQPSELIFSWSSHLLLLAPPGRVVYFGETNDACHEAKQYFSQFGLFPTDHQNPADFFLDCCASSATNAAGQSVKEAYPDSEFSHQTEQALENGDIVPRYQPPSIPWYQRILRRVRGVSEEQEDASGNKQVIPPQYASKYSQNYLVQSIYLISRNARSWWRNPVPVLIIFMNATLFALALGLLFSERDHSQLGAQESVSMFFFLNLILSTAVMSYIPQIFNQRAVFYRETASKAYNKIVYLFSLVLVVLIMLFLSSMLVAILVWSIGDLQTDWFKVGYYFGICILIPFSAYGFALVLSCIAPVPELANGLFSVVNIVNALTNGFLLLRTRIPDYFIWAYWAAYQHYSLEGFLLNELDGQNYFCKDNEGAIPVPVPSTLDPTRVQFYCQIESGEDMFDALEIHEGRLLTDILVLCGLVSGLFLIAAFIITKVKHIKR